MESHLEREIHEQPKILRRLIAAETKTIRRVVKRLRRKPPRFIVIAARGTSDNAAEFAKYALTIYNGVPVALAAPSIVTLYDCAPVLRSSLVIGISQSGQGADVCAVIDAANRQQAHTLAITNDGNSALAKAANDVILLEAGEERSVAATKTYTSELTAIAMLTAWWNGLPSMIAELDNLEKWAKAALKQEAAVQEIARNFQAVKEMYIISRGLNYATSYEISLKLKELVYIMAQPYSAADVRHGPIALVEEGFPCLAIAPIGKALLDMADLIATLKTRGARVAIISNDRNVLSQSSLAVRLPVELPEWLSPIIGVIPGQLLAFHMARLRGYDLDHPRGLRKITITV